MAIFKVADTFGLPSNQWFVLTGEVVDGVVKKGMKITLVDENHQDCSYPVSSIEFVRYSERRPSAETAIVIKYSSEMDLEELRSFDLNGRDLSVL